MTNLTEICFHPLFTRVLPGLKSISGLTSPWILAGASRLSNWPLKYTVIILQDYSHCSFFFFNASEMQYINEIFPQPTKF